MKKALKLLLVFAGLLVAGILLAILLTPWMDRWGATGEEIAAEFPGDQLLPDPAVVTTRAITVEATPEQIYPWIVQLGAGKGGYYTYSWFETNVLRCPLVNADRIHPEWQDLKVGDQVKMCPGEFGPPPYTVAQIEPERAIVLGHQEDGRWVELWQFVISPKSEGVSRLVVRSRSVMSGGFWAVIHPGIFIMERGMLHGIKERAETLEAEMADGNPH